MATATPAQPLSRSDVFIASMTSGAPPAAGDNAQEEPAWQQDLNQILMCPDCREFPPNLIEEFSSGDMVCASCGVVLGDRIIDTRSEWRTFANDDQNNDDPSRVGDSANPLLNGSQLETSIAFGDGKNSRDLQRAQNKLQKDKGTQTLLAAYREITNFCDAMNIAKTVQDAAKHIFKMVDDAKLFKGKSTEVIIAGCIFIACRQSNAPRTFREIFALTKVPKKEIGKTFKQLEKFLQSNPTGTTYLRPEQDEQDIKSYAPELCERYCNLLRFNNPHLMTRISSELCHRANDMVADIGGRSPLSLAASCIYFVAHLMGEVRPSKAIAQVAGVSDGTIKTAYRFLYQDREKLVTQDWIAKGASLDRLPAS
ncbi:cyclin-like protein [Xylariaceae sp. FL0255]|nr:cyclin-like protein [Xylariaceae sp. FL0255]